MRGIILEFIKNVSQIEKMTQNKIIGKPQLIDSEINFRGNNNILYCEGDIKLVNSKLNFDGNNSIVYLSTTESEYNLDIKIYNSSLIFIGKDMELDSNLNIISKEHQNVIIGSDCVFGKNVTVRAADNYPIYNLVSKQRVNFSKSVFIGDHVALGDYSYISSGARIGSGAVVENKTFIHRNFVGRSNSYILGNPAQIMQQEVFFTPDSLDTYTPEDSVNSSDYKSDIFIYNFVNNETFDLNKIDKILSDLGKEQKIEFVQKLFIQNKRKNRFTIR